MQTYHARPLDATKILTRRELAEVLNDLKRKAPRSKNTRLNLVLFRLACCCGLRVTLLDRFPATSAGHVAFLEFVRDEVRYAADAKRQQLAKGYSNDTLASMVRGIKWQEAGGADHCTVRSSYRSRAASRPRTAPGTCCGHRRTH
jgi:hypothetical protein